MTKSLAQELQEIERDLALLVARFMRLHDAVQHREDPARPPARAVGELPLGKTEPLVGYQ